MKNDVAIIGAGLVGSLLSVYLARRGHKVSVFERRMDMRKSEITGGRSINLALSDRGILALEKLDFAEEIKSIAVPMHGRFIHNLDGSTAFQPYGKQGQYIHSVSRAELNKKLMDLAEQNGVGIFFGKKCVSIDWEKNEISFEDYGNSSLATHQSELIFAADGAFSAARLQHHLKHEKFDYHQYYIDCGYKELTIPAGPGGSFLLERNALHIWPRKDYMLIGLPNRDGSFTCTLFFPFKGETSFEKLETKEKLTAFFDNTFPDVSGLIPDLAQQFLSKSVLPLVTIKCYPWIREDKFALIGDAAHAIVPFFGQGMNCGFEDCRILDQLIDQYNDDWKTILQEYQLTRKPDADAIADLAVNNYTEMRDRTADPKFLLQKKIEARLHEKYPGKWIPAYSQVTFSPYIRYSEALKRGQQQEEIMRDVMSWKHIEDKWESEEVLDQIIGKIEH